MKLRLAMHWMGRSRTLSHASRIWCCRAHGATRRGFDALATSHERNVFENRRLKTAATMIGASCALRHPCQVSVQERREELRDVKE